MDLMNQCIHIRAAVKSVGLATAQIRQVDADNLLVGVVIPVMICNPKEGDNARETAERIVSSVMKRMMPPKKEGKRIPVGV